MQKSDAKMRCKNAMEKGDTKTWCKRLMQKRDAKWNAKTENWKGKSEKWKVKCEMWNMKCEKSKVKLKSESINFLQKLLLGELSDWESENHGRSPELWSLFLHNLFCNAPAVPYWKNSNHNIKKMPSGEDPAEQIFFCVFFSFLKNENFENK